MTESPTASPSEPAADPAAPSLDPQTPAAATDGAPAKREGDPLLDAAQGRESDGATRHGLPPEGGAS